MVYIQALKRRAFLRQIVEGAIAGATTVGASLLAFQTSITSDSFKRGRIIVSTSGGGQSASFELGVQGKEFTQDNVLAMSEQFFDILSDALTYNTALTDDGNETSSRAILAQMMADDRLQTVTRRAADFGMLNWPLMR